MSQSGHLVFLQSGRDLSEVPAQGCLLHYLSVLPQPGLLLLTTVQELCQLQSLLQSAASEGQKGHGRVWGRAEYGEGSARLHQTRPLGRISPRMA